MRTYRVEAEPRATPDLHKRATVHRHGLRPRRRRAPTSRHHRRTLGTRPATRENR